ncbi:MAG: hypothetical protein OYG31_01700 [Candidatus Kaiserbacteria bacterium]|nr:hypothetical protein [Candidatus Kaiserbacteria bacterium]
MENITFEDMCGKNMLMTLGVGWADQSGTLYRALFVSSEKGKIIALTTRSFANKTVSFSLDGKRYTTFERQGKITLYGKTFYQFLVKDREGKRMTLHWFLSQSPARIVDALPDEVFFSGQRVRV